MCECKGQIVRIDLRPKILILYVIKWPKFLIRYVIKCIVQFSQSNHQNLQFPTGNLSHVILSGSTRFVFIT